MIVSIASQKGGTGKTSTTISLAAAIARRSDKVLLIDLDPQANSSKVLIPDYVKIPANDTTYSTIIEKKPLPLFPASVKNIHIAPAHILLSNADLLVGNALDRREDRLLKGIEPLKAEYQHIFIDTPPNLGWLTVNALTASDSVVVTCSPGYFELDSLNQMGKQVQLVRENYNNDLQLAGILFTMGDSTVSSRESLSVLRQTYTTQVFKSIIPRNVDLRDASFAHKDIFTYNPHCKAAEAYERVVAELGL